jgi:hypothetical protein
MDNGKSVQNSGRGSAITHRRTPMPLKQLAVDDSPHCRDGLVLHGYDGSSEVTAFISRRVMDDWVDPLQGENKRKSLFREEYNRLGMLNLAVIERIVSLKYQRGAAFNRQYPFVDVLLSDITESGELLDLGGLARFAPRHRSIRSFRY